VKAPRRRAKSFLVAVLVSAGVVGIAYGGVRYMRSHAAPALRYETVTVDRGRISAKVTASGALSALVTVQVGSQVSGRIESLRADFNTPVKKGQVIATIEPSLFQAALEQARANLAAARANLEQAKTQAMEADRQYTRAKNLFAENLMSKADVDAAEANAQTSKAKIAAMEASVQQTSAALHQAEINLKYTTIVSPIDGVVISRNVDVGQTVAASLQAPTLFTIAQDLTKMQVDTNVAEGDVGKIHPGMPVTFTVDAYPGKKFNGTVRQVRDAAQTIQNVVTYDAVVDVANDERLLKPGMTATVTFVHAEKDDVLRVPNAALRFKPDNATIAAMTSAAAASGGVAAPNAASAAPEPASSNGRERRGRGKLDLRADQRVVWLQRGGAPQPVTIAVGITDGTMTEVTEGELQPGDVLVTEAISSSGSSAGPRRGF
jgi:HlyD family secretion protein